MEHRELVRVLLVEDDEDDYILARDLFAEVPGRRFDVEWAKSFEAGLNLMSQNQHDVVLVDYRLGAHTGIDLLQAAKKQGGQAPVILLTGVGAHEVDLEAMQAGAADYLVKAQLRSDVLERSIRFALERRRASSLAAFEQARLAAFGAKVGLALTRGDSLDAILQDCANAMARFLNAALAQIAIYDPGSNGLQFRAAAGPLREESRQPKEPFVLPLQLLTARQPILLPQLLDDQRVADQAWVKREGLVSYAACPLLLEDKLLGLMSIFTQHPLTEQVWQEMNSVAHGISLCIQRKRSEAALDASEDKYRSVVESIKEVIFQLDASGRWTFLNPAWTSVTGFDIQSTLQTLLFDYLPPEDRARNHDRFSQLSNGRVDSYRHETRLLTKTGAVRWVEIYAQPTLTVDGTVVGVSGTLTDITERKLAESAIQKLAAFPQVNPNPVLEFGPDGALTYANEAASALTRFLGKDDVLALLPAGPDGIVRQCLADGQNRLDLQVRVDKRTLSWSFFPIAASQVVHCYGSDVTEMQSLEAQLRHAQKLESVGQLAAGIAHDFNNILTVIQGYSETLLAIHQSDPALATPLKLISSASHRAAALTRQLLAFSRKQVIQLKSVDLNELLQNLAKMLQRLLREDILLETSYARELPRIEADAGMVEQVVMNLAVNARDAMPKGGKLSITTSSAEITEDYVRLHPDARAGLFICLSVKDDGCGMDTATLERIFEPFFSTKEVGKGTGLGLATVYGIVQQHEGWIEVLSQPGLGTTFKIYLPAGIKPIETPIPERSSSDIMQGGEETILVVEDEPMVREFVRQVLRQYQYHVLEASSGTEALRIWEKCKGNIDLLLTDMVMPDGLTGQELVRELRRRKPGLKVICSSGYSPEVPNLDAGEDGVVFISKPYPPPQLIKAVRDLLDAKPNRSPKPAEYDQVVSVV